MPANQKNPRSDVRRLGVIAGIVLAVVIVGVIGAVVVLRPQPAEAPKPTNVDLPAAAPTAAPDLGQVGLVAGAARVQFIDKKDANRLAGVLEFRGLEPADINTARVLEPKGYIYDAAGRLIVVSADRGTLITPAQQTRPESGTFQGNVVLRMYPAGTPEQPTGSSSTPAKVPDAEPILVARTDALWFDLTLGEVSTQEKFIIRSPELEMDGRGMRLIVNEIEKGPELFEVASVTRLRMKTGGGAGARGNGSKGGEAKGGEAKGGEVKGGGVDGASIGGELKTGKNAAKTEEAALGRSRMYRAVMEDAVEFEQGPRKLSASRVEAFVKLIDGALADDAIADWSTPGDVAAGGGGSSDAGKGGGGATAPGVPIDIRWAGRLTIKPIAGMPTEFANASAGLRLLGGTSGPVRVADTELKLSGESPQVDYDATAGVLAMRGTQPQPAVASSPSVGTVRARGIELRPREKRADLIGPGTLTAADSETVLSFPQQVTAMFRQAAGGDVQLANVKVDGGLGLLSEQFAVSGDSAVVELDQESSTPQIMQVELRGKTKATAMRRPNDTLAADVLKLTFANVRDEAKGKAERLPDGLTLTGNARATSGRLVLTADTMTAQLAQESQAGRGRQTVVMAASAIGNAMATDNQGVVAMCDRIEFAPPAPQRLEVSSPPVATTTLYGTPVRVTRVLSPDQPGVELTSERVVIISPEDGIAGEQRPEGSPVVVQIEAGGRAASIPPKVKTAGKPAEAFEATWTRRLRFDNISGRLEAEGDVVMTMTQGEAAAPIERNTAKASRLTVQLRPQVAKSQPASGVGIEGDVQSIAIFGEQMPASVEHRRFASGGVRTQRLVYMESQQIDFAVLSRVVSVPVAGKLLVDQRDARGSAALEGAGSGPALSTPLGQVTNQGTSLFAWQGNLRMDLNAGQFGMEQGVSLLHRPSVVSGQAPAPTELTCDRLAAVLSSPSGLMQPSGGAEASLQSVEATGNVLIRESAGDGPTRLLQAHMVSYNAQQRIIEARGNQEMLVSFADPVKAPVRARALVWNQGTGEVRIVEPAPTTLAP